MVIRTAFLAALLAIATTSSAAYRTSVWVPPWTDAALTTVQHNAGAMQEANPVWYSWNADGSIAKNWNAENATWRAAMTGAQLIPTIQNVVNRSFNGSVAATLLGN